MYLLAALVSINAFIMFAFPTAIKLATLLFIHFTTLNTLLIPYVKVILSYLRVVDTARYTFIFIYL